MSGRHLLGTIVHKDGGFALLVSARCWYPLNGSSGIAYDFQETFSEARTADLGRRLYRMNGSLCMESPAQRDARIAEEMEKDR